MAKQYGMIRVDGNRPVPEVYTTLQEKIDGYLNSS